MQSMGGQPPETKLESPAGHLTFLTLSFLPYKMETCERLSQLPLGANVVRETASGRCQKAVGNPVHLRKSLGTEVSQRPLQQA